MLDQAPASRTRFYAGVFQSSLVKGSDALEIGVYTEVVTKAPFVEGGIEVLPSWRHVPEDVEVGDPVQVALHHTPGKAPHVREHRGLQHLGAVGGEAGVQRPHHSESESLRGYQGGGLHR